MSPHARKIVAQKRIPMKRPIASNQWLTSIARRCIANRLQEAGHRCPSVLQSTTKSPEIRIVMPEQKTNQKAEKPVSSSVLRTTTTSIFKAKVGTACEMSSSVLPTQQHAAQGQHSRQRDGQVTHLSQLHAAEPLLKPGWASISSFLVLLLDTTCIFSSS